MSHKKSDDVQGPMLDPSAANKNWVCVCLSHKSSHRHFTLFAAAAHVAYDLCLLQFWVLCQGVLAAAAEASCLWGLSSVADVCSLAWYTCCRINLGLLVLSRAWQTFCWGACTQHYTCPPSHQAHICVFDAGEDRGFNSCSHCNSWHNSIPAHQCCRLCAPARLQLLVGVKHLGQCRWLDHVQVRPGLVAGDHADRCLMQT